MTILTYIVVSLVVLTFCGLGLSIGLLLKRRGLTTCGRGVAEINGEHVGCPACSGQGECKRK